MTSVTRADVGSHDSKRPTRTSARAEHAVTSGQWYPSVAARAYPEVAVSQSRRPRTAPQRAAGPSYATGDHLAGARWGCQSPCAGAGWFQGQFAVTTNHVDIHIESFPLRGKCASGPASRLATKASCHEPCASKLGRRPADVFLQDLHRRELEATGLWPRAASRQEQSGCANWNVVEPSVILTNPNLPVQDGRMWTSEASAIGTKVMSEDRASPDKPKNRGCLQRVSLAERPTSARQQVPRSQSPKSPRTSWTPVHVGLALNITTSPRCGSSPKPLARPITGRPTSATPQRKETRPQSAVR